MFALTLAFASPLHAQQEKQKEQEEKLPTAKEVIAKFVEATGGAKAYKALEGRRITGKMEIEKAGISGKLTTTSATGGKSYTEVNIEGMGKEEVGGDGDIYWSKSAFTGTRIIEGNELSRHIIENDLQGVLHQDKYYKDMKVTGIEKVNDEDHYRLEKVNKLTGDKQIDFYSVKTGLSSKSVIPMTTPLGKLKIEIMISDYRKVGDLTMSHTTVNKLPGNMIQKMSIEKVELNPKIDAAVFELPEEIVKLKKRAAEKKAAAAEKAKSESAEKKAELEPVGAQ